MLKEFITYDLALELKALRYDKHCIAYYDQDKRFYPVGHSLGPDSIHFGIFVPELQYRANNGLIAAPMYQQVFDWFREEYLLYPEIGLHDRENDDTWRITISILGVYDLAYNQNVGIEPYYKTYNEAKLASIRKMIDIVKKS